MKLIGLEGEQAGCTVEVGALGVTLGREQDNDVVLTEGQLSRYHARVAQQDSVWFVYDLDSTNGVYLNEKRVDKSAPLSIHDRIRIGTSKWMFTDDAGSVPGGSNKKTASAGDVDGKADEVDAAKTRRKRMLGLAVILLLLVLVMVQVVMLAGSQSDPQETAFDPTNGQPFRLRYEKFTIDDKGVFRYALRVEGALLRVQVDDLRNRRHLEEQAELSPELLAQLKKVGMDEEFLDLALPASLPSQTRVDETRLTVWQGRSGNAVAIVNDVLPPVVQRIADELEVVVEELLGVGAVPLTREEILDRARERFAFAERCYVEREVKADNLYHALAGYRFVREYLAGFDDRPEFYETAVRREREVDTELEEKLQQLQYAARMQVRVDDLDQARQLYEEIVNRVPDPKHPVVQNARDQIFKIARRQEAQKKARKN